jgi:hypothetical protein
MQGGNCSAMSWWEQVTAMSWREQVTFPWDEDWSCLLFTRPTFLVGYL